MLTKTECHLRCQPRTCKVLGIHLSRCLLHSSNSGAKGLYFTQLFQHVVTKPNEGPFITQQNCAAKINCHNMYWTREERTFLVFLKYYMGLQSCTAWCHYTGDRMWSASKDQICSTLEHIYQDHVQPECVLSRQAMSNMRTLYSWWSDFFTWHSLLH